MKQVAFTIIFLCLLFTNACNTVSDIPFSSEESFSTESNGMETELPKSEEPQCTPSESAQISQSAINPPISGESLVTPKPKVDQAMLYYAVKNTEQLFKVIREIDAVTYQEGSYFSLLQSIQENTHLLMPKTDGSIQITQKNSYPINLCAETETEAPGIRYRLTYKGKDALVTVYYLPKAERDTAKEEVYRYQGGKKQKLEITLDQAKGNGWIETAIKCGEVTRNTWGCAYNKNSPERYRIWFVYDELHAVTVDWLENPNGEEAEEFVSKLEFEKVELQPVTEAPEPILPAGKVTPTPEAKTTPGAEKVTP